MSTPAVFEIQWLESRTLLAVTPADVLTKPMRQELLNELSINIKASLQSELNANDLAGFDQQLLDFFEARTGSHFFFDPDEIPGLVSYHNTELNPSDVISRADEALANNNTDPSDPDASSGRYDHWIDLGMAYRLNGNGAYADKIVEELAQFAVDNPPLADPNTWRNADPDWQRLPTSIHGDTWSWAYALMIGTAKWNGEANTLFLKNIYEHGRFLVEVEPDELYSNQALIHGQGLTYIGQYFPEFTDAATWEAEGRDLLFDSMDEQIYPDGSHYEQSPNYAAAVIQRLLETKQLDARNGVSWESSRSAHLTKAVAALYQFLSPDGETPAVGDTYRNSLAYYFLKANIIQNSTAWPAGKPRAKDLWLLGSAAVDPYKDNPATPALGTRGKAFPLPDSGNYIFRSGDDTGARQLILDTGPRGGGHGHYDLLNFELFAHGRAVISDPGLYKYDSSSKRKWAVSTPAHNTVSVDGKNLGALEGDSNPGIVVDKYTAGATSAQVTAHHWGYAGLGGRPVVTRSLWYDYDGTVLVVDWVEGTESRNAQTSFLIPGTNTTSDLAAGWIQSNHASGGNVRVQSLLRSGQAAVKNTSGIFTSNGSSENPAATQFAVKQNGASFIVFATLITAYDGTVAPNTSASWLTTSPAKGTAVKLRLNKNGVNQDITFTPPKLKYPNSKATSKGTNNDIVYDAQGRLHYAYYDPSDKFLKYTVRGTNGKWSPVEIVEGRAGIGLNPSIAINSVGVVGIAYRNPVDKDLVYASHNGSAWDIQTADSAGDTGLQPSLAFARFDLPFITYYDASKKDLRMATIDEGEWKLTTLDAGFSGGNGAKDVGRFSQLVLDPSRPTSTKWGIVYEDTSNKRYLYAIQGNINKTGATIKGAYTMFEVAKASSLGGYTSLAYDSQNRPTVAFYDKASTGIKFAQASSTASGGAKFTVTTAVQSGSVGQFSQLIYDSSNRPTLLYLNSDTQKVNKAVFSSGAWTTSALVDGGREIRIARYNSKIAYTNRLDAKNTLEVLFI
jgi:hypothetical protein